MLEKNTHHRDIKPDNILLFNLNDRVIIKLADFGISKENDSHKKTLTATVIGTPAYLSPSLRMANLLGEDLINHSLEKSDVFSLGKK